RLKRQGRLTVSLASFRRYVRDVLPELVERVHITVRRPDPPPGEEAQVDYGLLRMWVDPFTGKRRAVQAFAMVLSHSRHMYGRGASSSARGQFPLVLQRGVGARGLVEACALVVVGVGAQEPVVTPYLHGRGANAQLCGDLLQGEHTGGTQAGESIGELVAVAD